MIAPNIITTSKEIGVGTSESLPRSTDKRKSKKDKKEKEAKREKERAQAEAIDKEILGKKASLERPKSKAPKPPKTYFTDNNKNCSKIDLPNTVSTSERKKNFLQSIENKEPNANKKQNVNKKTEAEVPPPPPPSNQRYQTKETEIIHENGKSGTTGDTIDKKPSQKDRSVDVYHETVRQRVTRSTEAVKDVFTADQETTTTPMSKKSTAKAKKQRAPQHPQKDFDEELPSVRELRSKFEISKATGAKQSDQAAATKKNAQSSSSPTKKSSKIDFKKGFNVMSSLTRRSAMSVSKSMQNLSIDNKKEDCKKNDKNAEESGITMDFSHFTFAETTEPQEDEVQPAKKQSSPKVTVS